MKTERTTLKRLPERGSHDRADIDAILDEALVCHLGVVDGEGRPFVVPTIHARLGDRLVLHGSPASRALRTARDGGVDVCVTVTLLDGLVLVRREWPTDIGPVDLLCRDAAGGAVAVEIKRVGDIDGVEQLARYLERLDLDPTLAPVRGIFAAQVIKPQAKVLAAARGIECVEVDYDALRGIESNILSLF